MEDTPRKDNAPSEEQALETSPSDAGTATTAINIKPSSFSLQKWTLDVRSAPTIGKAEEALNRSAFTVGLQIPRDRVDETIALQELIKAGTDVGLSASAAENIVKRALRDGKRVEEKRIEKRNNRSAARSPSPTALDEEGAS